MSNLSKKIATVWSLRLFVTNFFVRYRMSILYCVLLSHKSRSIFFLPHEVPDESWASESNMMINRTVCGLCKKICLPLLTCLYHYLLRITSRSYHARIYRKHCAGNGTSSSATSRKSTSSTRNISSESWSNVQTCHWLWASASSTTRISSTCTPCTTRISPSLMLSWLSMDRRFSRWEKEKRLGMF